MTKIADLRAQTPDQLADALRPLLGGALAVLLLVLKVVHGAHGVADTAEPQQPGADRAERGHAERGDRPQGAGHRQECGHQGGRE